ncbi:alpha/beta hydrolase family protein [Phytomonospora endophytica]|uniref:Dienelactone hydrolase n=1 Tax=Phytomonospora endophytica TaxID=714109 RepID=A0A841FJE7_9ACTN|nr:alpha/beta hydrolase [Phytomonospora endophytica]MBB6036316.1 dienelactone hydrolase [Phytomonospora endophytica]GIG67223.1 lipase [Phytomonospora endophytica]
MRHIRTAAVGVLTGGLLVAAAVASPASAAPSPPPLTIPAPTGPLPVGVTDFHLVDADRADPWVPAENRELMVSAWYPAKAPVGALDAYASPEESALILRGLGAGDIAPPDALSRIVTHSHVDAPVRGRRLPTVVLSPGFSMPRSSLTGLAEDLAGRGYLVIGVDHTYEASAITFPDGRITQCAACEVDPEGADVARGRALDVSFVLDELTGVLPVDERRIIMGGHSMGGASSVPLLAADERVRAGFDLDGTVHVQPSGDGAGKPFMLVGAPYHAPDGKYGPKIAEVMDGFGGWKRWITVDGTGHSSFTDYGPIADQLGIPLGTTPGDRAMEITRSLVGAFADRHLRGLPSPVLNHSRGEIHRW